MPIHVSGKIWVGVLLMLLGMLPPARAMTTLDHVSVSIERKNDHAPQAAIDVTLPYNWDTVQGGVDGRARFLLPFASRVSADSQALFVERIGNGFEVVLNSVVLGSNGSPGDPYADHKKPAFFIIPPGLLRNENILSITIDAQSARHAGLSPVVFGPADEVQELYEHSYRWRRTGYFVVSIISGVLGTLALLLWLRQRELMYAFYGLGELLWAFRMSDAQFDNSPLPWPWWGIFVFSAQGIGSVLTMKFLLSVMGRHHGTIKRITDWYLLLTIPIVALSLIGGWPMLSSVWSSLMAPLLIAVAVIVVPQGLGSSALEKRVLVLAFMVITVAAFHDLILFRILPGFSGVLWTIYAWVLLGISLAWIIAERMRKSTREIASMNQTLSQRLAERELELNAVFALQAETGRRQAMLEERQRLTRDMHDGLGSQLVGALQLAKNPGVTKEMLAVQLRETLDHLKLTVDAMQDTQGDIASLLGALRYRLNPRLAAAGVQLAWSVEPLPEIAGWTLQNSRDLQMILFEAFSNLITHASATHATLRAAPSTRMHEIRIALQDNGRGFDVDAMTAAGGHGLANMRARAARIGAELHIESTAQGTTTSLALALPDPDLQA